MNEEKGTIYANPESYDLELVGEIDKGESYEFDITVVYKHTKTGVLYVGSDSGCSCPSPFEAFYSLSDLQEVNPRNYQEFETLLREVGVSILDIIELKETALQMKEAEDERRSRIE